VLLNEKFGYIDKNGTNITALFMMIYIPDFMKGLLLFLLMKMGIYRLHGKDLVPCIYDKGMKNFIMDLPQSLLMTKWSFVDNYGNMIGSSNYHSVNSFSEGMAAVSIDKKWVHR